MTRSSLSPLVVEFRVGIAVARCSSPHCDIPRGAESHLVHAGKTISAAEQAAEEHLQTLNRKGPS